MPPIPTATVLEDSELEVSQFPRPLNGGGCAGHDLNARRLDREKPSDARAAVTRRHSTPPARVLFPPFDHATTIDYDAAPTKHGEPSGDHDGGSDSGSSGGDE